MGLDSKHLADDKRDSKIMGKFIVVPESTPNLVKIEQLAWKSAPPTMARQQSMDITDLMTGKSTGTGENKSYNETMSITGMSGVSCLLDSATIENLRESKTTKSEGNKSLLSGALTSGMTGLSEMDQWNVFW